MKRNQSPWESPAYSHPNNSESRTLFLPRTTEKYEATQEDICTTRRGHVQFTDQQWKELYGYVIRERERRFVWFL
ncbi:hypothetical protein EUGRSUZ_F02726 [Eucalyptus grandis]|uniref:Uncharacterized protein n=2 Tax=Eucalyptus grandis TaxID=71139 RepID=A0ACC3KJA4_EUCGR|nr:hypothetical protein EUGRSUZ_F02726 [Eucalyptus grandis]